MESATALPAGTITFLFSDIEGSTRLWEQHPGAMEAALARHDALAAAVIQQHEGYLVKHRGEGDSLFAVFARAADAVAAAVALQQELCAELWAAEGQSQELSLRVRMALHTGDAAFREGDYFGAAVNRCARLRAVAHGGQLLLSSATQELVRDSLPEGVSFRDLGEHRLRDLARPERVFQLLHPDLPADFAPLASLNTLPNNLPQQVTSFIGREKEMAEVRRLLATTRLLTLTGSGGTGKTRLSLQVAADLLGEYPDGVWLVELAALSDPVLVPQSAATVLGVREDAGKPPLQALAEQLRPKRMLLMLDNCEHLLSACASLAETLLRTCPEVKILASSREGLNIPGERTYRVPSLSLPEPGRLPSIENQGQYEAVRLFIDRAVFHQPSFAVTNENAPSVAQICHRLDGIPLAIELAAARIRALSAEKIAERLDDRFRLLTGGSRTALPRQQTLRALIDWSYHLLSPAEQLLLRRLSVLSGGWTLEAVESVCADLPSRGHGESEYDTTIEEWQVLDLLTSLIDKSLVVVEESGGRTRYRFLETVRQYARDRLLESAEGRVLRSRHLQYFMTLAEQAEAEYWGPGMVTWLDRLELELDNLRAALDWRAGETEPAEEWLRLQAALPDFWVLRDHITEGRAWVDQAGTGEGFPASVRAPLLAAVAAMRFWTSSDPAFLDLVDESLELYTEIQDPQRMSWLLFTHAFMARFLGDPVSSRAWSEKTLAVSRPSGIDYVTAWCLLSLGTIERRTPEGIALLEESVELARRCGNPWVQAWAIRDLGHALFEHRQPEQGRALLAESQQLFQAVGCRWAITWSLESLGMAALTGGDLAAARGLFDDTIALWRELRDRGGQAGALLNAGRVARDQGDTTAARAYFTDARRIAQELGDARRRVAALHNLGEIARLEQAYEEARQLLEQSLTLAGSADDRDGILASLHKQAMLATDQGEWARARAQWVDLITRAREWERKHAFPDAAWIPGSNPPPELFDALEGISRVWLQQGEARRAARLLGAVTGARNAAQPALWGYQPSDHAPAENILPALQAALGPEGFEAGWTEGQGLTLALAIAAALEQENDA